MYVSIDVCMYVCTLACVYVCIHLSLSNYPSTRKFLEIVPPHPPSLFYFSYRFSAHLSCFPKSQKIHVLDLKAGNIFRSKELVGAYILFPIQWNRGIHTNIYSLVVMKTFERINLINESFVAGSPCRKVGSRRCGRSYWYYRNLPPW